MRTLADLGEFGLIDRIAARTGPSGSPAVVLGIGDDAAILRTRRDEDTVVSSDACVEDVHFTWARHAPALVGRRALVANLSDLAAMGARPLGFTCALSAPPSLALRRFDGLLDGLLRAAATWDCPLVGGNLTRAARTHVTIAVIGAVRRGRALRRDALRAGDRLFVTGTLGRSALDWLRASRTGARARHVAVPRLEAGRALSRLAGARTACIDLSDGLAGDLAHLTDASGVGAEIDAARLPLPRGFARAVAKLGEDPLGLAVAGGEDYELLFGLPERVVGAGGGEALGRRLGVMVTEVGRATRSPGVRGLPAVEAYRHW